VATFSALRVLSANNVSYVALLSLAAALICWAGRSLFTNNS